MNNNENELIKDILDQRNKKSSHFIHLNHSSSMQKMALLNESVNGKQVKEVNVVNAKNSQMKNDQLLGKEIVSDCIKLSIENEARAQALRKNSKVNFPRSPSPLTSSCSRTKVKKRFYQPQYDYFKHKYEKYNMQLLAYQIEKEFSKVNSNNTTFNERLQFSVAKQKIKEEKINELVDLTKPHIEEKKKVATFNRLIQDANRRIEIKRSLENINSDTLLMNAIQSNQRKRSSSVNINHEEWTKIYQDRFMSKLFEKNEKIKVKQQAQEQKMKDEEEKIEEQKMKRKKFVSKKEIDAIALRLHSHNYRLLIQNNKENSICNKSTHMIGKSKSSSKKNSNNKQVYKYQENFSEGIVDDKSNSNNNQINQIGVDNYIFNNQTNYQTPVARIEEKAILFNKAEKIINDFFIKQNE